MTPRSNAILTLLRERELVVYNVRLQHFPYALINISPSIVSCPVVSLPQTLGKLQELDRPQQLRE